MTCPACLSVMLSDLHTLPLALNVKQAPGIEHRFHILTVVRILDDCQDAFRLYSQVTWKLDQVHNVCIQVAKEYTSSARLPVVAERLAAASKPLSISAGGPHADSTSCA